MKSVNSKKLIPIILLSLVLLLVLTVLLSFYIKNTKQNNKKIQSDGKVENFDICSVSLGEFKEEINMPETGLSKVSQLDNVRANYNKLIDPIYSETPEKAIMSFSDALINGKRNKAVKYIYIRPTEDISKWYSYTEWICDKKNKRLAEFGRHLINGKMKKNGSNDSRKWVVEFEINGQTVKAPIGLTKIKDKGWQIIHF